MKDWHSGAKRGSRPAYQVVDQFVKVQGGYYSQDDYKNF